MGLTVSPLLKMPCVSSSGYATVIPDLSCLCKIMDPAESLCDARFLVLNKIAAATYTQDDYAHRNPYLMLKPSEAHNEQDALFTKPLFCLLYTSPSPRD